MLQHEVSATPLSLLEADEPPVFQLREGGATSPYVITVDHAGNRLPRALGDLGLTRAELATHIAWDIGAAGVAERLAETLDAFMIAQNYSRLVIDCNRPLHSPSSIVEQSEYTAVPGNRGLSAEAADLRARSIFRPYHGRIEQELDRRERARQPTVLVTVHSFTPTFMGVSRFLHAGVLYQRDPRFAHAMLAELRREPGLVVGDNQPYKVSDLTDYAVVQYGERRGLLHVELEVRQDLIADSAGQTEWAERFARLLPRAYQHCLAG
jgi:predicted N-formylglutamate amidohydrolase